MATYKPRALTPKQARFVEEYLVDLNADAAAVRAGYRKNGYQGRVLGNFRVRAAVQEAMAKRSQRTEITQDRVLAEYAPIAFSDMGDVLDFGNGTLALKEPAQISEAARRAIQSIKVKRKIEGRGEQAGEVEVIDVKLWPKTEALAKLAEHLGMFVKRPEEPGALNVILRALYQQEQAENARARDIIEANELPSGGAEQAALQKLPPRPSDRELAEDEEWVYEEDDNHGVDQEKASPDASGAGEEAGDREA